MGISPEKEIATLSAALDVRESELQSSEERLEKALQKIRYLEGLLDLSVKPIGMSNCGFSVDGPKVMVLNATKK